jgi:hypothetical protein
VVVRGRVRVRSSSIVVDTDLRVIEAAFCGEAPARAWSNMDRTRDDEFRETFNWPRLPRSPFLQEGLVIEEIYSANLIQYTETLWRQNSGVGPMFSHSVGSGYKNGRVVEPRDFTTNFSPQRCSLPPTQQHCATHFAHADPKLFSRHDSLYSLRPRRHLVVARRRQRRCHPARWVICE